MAKDRSLKSALDRFQKKDLKVEHQKKHEKEVHKKQNKRKQQTGEEVDGADAEEDGGVILPSKKGALLDEDDESASDEARPAFDLSRLDDSDSDSESDEDEDQEDGVDANGGEDILAEEDDDEDDASIALSDISADEEGEDIVPHQRLTINNTAALTKALNSISLPYASLTFSEHQSLTTKEPVAIADVEDDLTRELAFLGQALEAAKSGRKLLRKEGTPFTRPVDYFAEMVKTDEHMGKVKAKLVDDAAAKKASAEARKQRDLKKFGKQVQQEKLKERAKEKKDMLEKVKILKRKRASTGVEADREENLFDVALEDAATTDKQDRLAKRARTTSEGQMGPKRAKKNEKFGFGGKKRFSKSTDAVSTGDMTGYSSKKMKGKVSKNGASKRLGKARRAKA